MDFLETIIPYAVRFSMNVLFWMPGVTDFPTQYTWFAPILVSDRKNKLSLYRQADTCCTVFCSESFQLRHWIPAGSWIYFR